MSFDANQEAEVTITGTVHRLVPCPEHAQDPPGVQLARRNPNGYDHDCPACTAAPVHEEALEA